MDDLTVEQVAELVKSSTKTVRRKIQTGEYSAYKGRRNNRDCYLLSPQQFDVSFMVEEVITLPTQITTSDFKRLIQASLQPVLDDNKRLYEELTMLRQQLEKQSKKGYTRSWKK